MTEFSKYLKEARQEFCKEVNKYNVSDNLQLRTACDSFLIAFDQATEKAINHSQCCETFVRFNGIKTKCFNPSSKYKVLDDKEEHYLITDDENDVIWVFKKNFTIITE